MDLRPGDILSVEGPPFIFSIEIYRELLTASMLNPRRSSISRSSSSTAR